MQWYRRHSEIVDAVAYAVLGLGAITLVFWGS